MKKKTLVMLLCSIVMVAGAALGTIAYFTDREGITNTFTVGNVIITLDEAKVDENGQPVVPAGRTEDGNQYPLMPGATYTKDPMITVAANSEESYVRMQVVINNAEDLTRIFAQLQAMYPETYPNGFLPQEHVIGWDQTVWPCHSMIVDTDADTITLEFRYKEKVASSEEAQKLDPLFDEIKIPKELSYSQLQDLTDLKIEVFGHAIQTTGFNDDANEAWAAFDAQTKAEDDYKAGQNGGGTTTP